MVFTVQRYIFRELFKVFLLASIALTLILSLGSILRPVQEYGVGPRQVVHIMVYFLPVTLTVVLPMAALFAASLVYGRFASDNELDACKASGISLLTLVYPGLALAVLVATVNLSLSFYVMPYFVHLAERSLKADAKHILFRNMERRGYYKLPPDKRYIFYADDTDPDNDMLHGVVAISTQGGVIDRIIAAESARIRFYLRERINEVQLTTHNTYQMATGDDYWYFFELVSLTKEFGSLLGDDIKFKKIHEMKQVRRDLTLFDPIAKIVRQARTRFAAELLAREISDQIADGGTCRLPGRPKSVHIRARGCSVQGENGVTLAEGVVVEEYETDQVTLIQRLRSPKAVLYIKEDDSGPTLTLDMYNARAEDSGVLQLRHFIDGLQAPEVVSRHLGDDLGLSGLDEQSVTEALGTEPTPTLQGLLGTLAREIRLTLLEIKAEVHSRLVFGIGVVPMILIGIGLGIVKRGGHLLSAFAAACVPAAVLLVCIISGKHVTENPGSSMLTGMVLMWAGLGSLVAFTVVLYRFLLRH